VSHGRAAVLMRGWVGGGVEAGGASTSVGGGHGSGGVQCGSCSQLVVVSAEVAACVLLNHSPVC